MLIDKILVIIRKFWKFKIWVVAIPLASAALVFFLTKDQERKYISKATLQVSLPTSGEVSLTGTEFKQYETSMFFYDLIEVINSLKTMEMVRLEALKKHLEGKYDKFTFEKDPTLVEDTTKIYERISELRKNYSLLNLRDTFDIAITVLLENNRFSIKEMKGQLKAYRVGKSNYVDIVIESENPYKSAFIAKLYLEIITEQYQRVSKKKIENNRERLEGLVEKAKADLDTKIRKLEGFKIENNIINLPEHTKAIVNQIVNMEVKLAHLRETLAAHTKAAEASKQKLKYASDLNFNDDANKKIASLKDSLKNLNNQLLFFEGKATEKQELEAKASLVKNEIISSISEMVQKVPYDPSQARQELMMRFIGYEIDKEMESIMIPAVENELKRLNTYAAKFAPLESSIGTLMSEIHTAQESYLILLSKLNLVRTIEQGSGDVQISTFAPPTLPREPESSKRAFMIVGAFVASFVLIAAGIVTFVLLDKKVYMANHYEDVTKLHPSIVLHTDKELPQEIKRLRKKIVDLPVELRVIVIIGLSEKDKESSFNKQMVESLSQFPGKVMYINASGSEEEYEKFNKADLNLEEDAQTNNEQEHLIMHWYNENSPFEAYEPDLWKKFFQKKLGQYHCLVISAKPALLNADWEEWLALAHAVITVRQGGQAIGDKEMSLFEEINDSKKSLIANVFIEKEQ